MRKAATSKVSERDARQGHKPSGGQMGIETPLAYRSTTHSRAQSLTRAQ